MLTTPDPIIDSGPASGNPRPCSKGRYSKRRPVRFTSATRGFRFETQAGDFIRELPALDLEQADLLGYLPLDLALPVPFQLPLPLAGV